MNFACGLDEEEEISISDNHYAEEELEAAKARSVKHYDQSEETFLDNDPLLTPGIESSSATYKQQSQTNVSSSTNTNPTNGDDGALYAFESHFNECNNVERTAAMETGHVQNGHAATAVEQDGRTPSDIDNDNETWDTIWSYYLI